MDRFKQKLIAVALLATVNAGGATATRITCRDACSMQDLTTGNSEAVPAGEGHAITEATLVSSDGKVPMIIIPACNAQQVTVDPPILKQVVSKSSSESIDQALAESVENISIIQQLIRERQISAAESALQSMRLDHPKLHFLNFIEASLAVLKGNRTEAIRLTEEGLKAHPQYKEGILLLKTLRRER